MREEKHYYVYMLTSSSRRALYTGITNDLIRRILQHRESVEGFTAQYRCYRLVYYEVFHSVRFAIAREKEIKGWTRAKKNALVGTKNPSWRDLALDLGLDVWPPQDDSKTQGPSLRSPRRPSFRMTSL